MASLNVTFCKIGATVHGHMIPVSDSETAVSETLTTSGSNTQSAASTLTFVRLVSDAAHWVAIGSNPDATTTTGRFYLPANTVEYFQIEIGNKVAGITA
jgi:hypothetical protein